MSTQDSGMSCGAERLMATQPKERLLLPVDVRRSYSFFMRLVLALLFPQFLLLSSALGDALSTVNMDGPYKTLDLFCSKMAESGIRYGFKNKCVFGRHAVTKGASEAIGLQGPYLKAQVVAIVDMAAQDGTQQPKRFLAISTPKGTFVQSLGDNLFQIVDFLGQKGGRVILETRSGTPIGERMVMTCFREVILCGSGNGGVLKCTVPLVLDSTACKDYDYTPNERGEIAEPPQACPVKVSFDEDGLVLAGDPKTCNAKARKTLRVEFR